MILMILDFFMSKNKNTSTYLSNISFLLGVPSFLFFLFFLLIPVILLNIISFKERDITSGVLDTWSLDSWRFILNNKDFHSILFNTLNLSFNVTLSCILISYLLLFFMKNFVKKIQFLIIIILIFPISFDILIKNLGWISFLGYNGFLNILFAKLGIIDKPIIFLFSDIAVYLSQVINFTPLMTLSIWISYLRINSNIILGAEDLGATSLNVFLEIILPLTKKGLLSGGILVFTSSLVNFIIPEIIGGSKKYYLGNLIKFEFFDMKNWSFGSAISIFVYLISIIFSIVLFLIINFNHLLKKKIK